MGRIEALRARLAAEGAHGLLVPLSDAHMSEYVGAEARRLEWLTGFTGSAGLAVVLAGRVALFTDGRYAIQAREEVPAGVEVCVAPTQTPAGWLAASVPPGALVRYDPWLHTRRGIARLRAALPAGARLEPGAANPIDALWTDRPAPSAAPAEVHALAFAGWEAGEKRRVIAEAARAHGADAVLVTALDSVAWALNLRGRDVVHTPVVRAFLLVAADARATLFIDEAKVSPAVRAHLGREISLRPYAALPDTLRGFPGRVALDPQTCVAALHDALSPGQAVEARDPCVWPRAIKTPVELAGAAAAHRRDGVALCRFLHWVETAGLAKGADELEAAAVLEGLRRDNRFYREPSFATISAVGPGAALPHYAPRPAHARRLQRGTFYLVDSGGQYEDGTTDVTRTVALGAPTAAMRRHFTLALRAHLAIAALTVPPGTTGGQLDAIARRPLWEAGLDYATGTGHGVGTCLSVHEGPVFIGRPGGTRPVDEPLAPNLLLTVEPGLYLEGEYGIRTENVYRVAARDNGWLGFEPLTRAPIDRTLIAVALLTAGERDWIDRYHAGVLSGLAPELEPDVRAWLEQACAPL